MTHGIYLILPLWVRIVQNDLIHVFKESFCILQYSVRYMLKRIGIFFTLCPWDSDNAGWNRFSNTIVSWNFGSIHYTIHSLVIPPFLHELKAYSCRGFYWGTWATLPPRLKGPFLSRIFRWVSTWVHVENLGALTGFCAQLAARTLMFSCASFKIKIQI